MTYWIIVFLFVSPCMSVTLNTADIPTQQPYSSYSMPTCNVTTTVEIVYSREEAEKHAGAAHDIFQVQDGKVTRMEVEAVYEKRKREVEETVIDHCQFKK